MPTPGPEKILFIILGKVACDLWNRPPQGLDQYQQRTLLGRETETFFESENNNINYRTRLLISSDAGANNANGVIVEPGVMGEGRRRRQSPTAVEMTQSMH